MIEGDKIIFRGIEKGVFIRVDNTYSIPAYIINLDSGIKLCSFSLAEIEVLK